MGHGLGQQGELKADVCAGPAQHQIPAALQTKLPYGALVLGGRGEGPWASNLQLVGNHTLALRRGASRGRLEHCDSGWPQVLRPSVLS